MQKQPPQVFSEKGVLKNFANFTGKHLYQKLFFNKVACLGNRTPSVVASGNNDVIRTTKLSEEKPGLPQTFKMKSFAVNYCCKALHLWKALQES